MKLYVLLASALVVMLAQLDPAAAADEMEACSTGRLEARIQACKAIIAKGGENTDLMAEAHRRLANAYADTQKFADAYLEYDLAIALTPDNPDIYFSRSTVYEEENDWDAALGDLAKAEELNPDDAWIYNNRAWIYHKSGRSAEGLAEIEKALTLDASEGEFNDTRAHLYQNLGRNAEAIEEYGRAMERGGPDLVELYQQQLKRKGLYKGKLDGFRNEAIDRAIAACVTTEGCDPRPETPIVAVED